jgi:hypothetical protein
MSYGVMTALAMLLLASLFFEMPNRVRDQRARALVAKRFGRKTSSSSGDDEASARSLWALLVAFLPLLGLVLANMACIIALIYMNSWIIEDMFPWAATLTFLQMAFTSLAAFFLVYVCRATPPPSAALTPALWFGRFVPLGALYAIYLWGSNKVYDYLEVRHTAPDAHPNQPQNQSSGSRATLHGRGVGGNKRGARYALSMTAHDPPSSGG